MRIGGLFSGIGGLELGLEAELGTTSWHVERDPWCCDVLRRHWPESITYQADIATVRAESLSGIDLLCGGFPCQDVSSAGRQAEALMGFPVGWTRGEEAA